MRGLVLLGGCAATVAVVAAVAAWPDDEPAVPIGRAAPSGEPAAPGGTSRVPTGAGPARRPMPTPRPRRGEAARPEQAAVDSAPVAESNFVDEPPPEVPSDPRQAEIAAAQRALDHKEYERAAELGDALVAHYPDQREAYLIAVQALCAMGEADRAMAHLVKMPRNRDKRRLVRLCGRLGLTLTLPAAEPTR